MAAVGAVDVVGYSLGARLAWDLAGSGVRRLVLGGLAAGDPFAGIDGDEVAAAVAGGAPANPVVGFVAEAARAPGCDAATIVAFVEGLGAEPFLPWTRPPQCPALFVSGWDDEVAKGVESVAALAPDGRVQRIDGDHEGALHSAAFQAAAISFLTA
jgi:pimeloyl-ACP methyl ester carboxylesterase